METEFFQKIIKKSDNLIFLKLIPYNYLTIVSVSSTMAGYHPDPHHMGGFFPNSIDPRIPGKFI